MYLLAQICRVRSCQKSAEDIRLAVYLSKISSAGRKRKKNTTEASTPWVPWPQHNPSLTPPFLVDFFGATHTSPSIMDIRQHWSPLLPASYRGQALDQLRMSSTLVTLKQWQPESAWSSCRRYIPGSTRIVDTWSTEVSNIEMWAKTNNLVLNHKKFKIIFIDPRRKRQFMVPSSLRGIVRDTSVKILGVDLRASAISWHRRRKSLCCKIFGVSCPPPNL